jgi:ABC-type molybdate transport system permease subunit
MALTPAVVPIDWSPIRISLETSSTATLITLVAGLAAAAWRERRTGPAAVIVDGIFLLPLVLPPTVVGFLLLLLFGRNGPFGKFLLQLGASVVFSFARALGEFGATLMIAGNVPGRTATIPIAIYFAVEANDVSRAAVWCVIDVLISLVLLAGLYSWTCALPAGRPPWAGR